MGEDYVQIKCELWLRPVCSRQDYSINSFSANFDFSVTFKTVLASLISCKLYKAFVVKMLSNEGIKTLFDSQSWIDVSVILQV